MKIELDRSGTHEALFALIDNVIEEGMKGILILACDENGFSPALIDEPLKKISMPVLGGIFPEIIWQQEKLIRGTIVIGLPVSIETLVINQLSDESVDYETIIDEKIGDVPNMSTAFIFVDGFSARISALIDSLFNIFGLEVNYIGGGAGSLSMQQKPCIFTNDGLLEDCAVLAITEVLSGVGVAHGWETISEPFKVTEVEQNRIFSLDWEPAFEVYKSVIKEHIDVELTPENFFQHAKGFPFGISKMGSEKVIRDPIVVEADGSIICVGELPKESFVNIMIGKKDALIAAAEKALQKGMQAFPGSCSDKSIFFIDCISRTLFLENDFGKELKVVNQDSELPVFGILSIGEIANSGKDYLEFYNKTSVVGILGHG